MKVAALYVDARGPYPKMPIIDAWDIERDATKYGGPWPVIAHPPCGPWGRLRHLYKGPESDKALALIAVEQVQRYGGVLEHPAFSKLWPATGLPVPGERDAYGFTIQIDQCDWGHVARKRTWLYIVGVDIGELKFPPPGTPTHWIGGFRLSAKHHPTATMRDHQRAVPPGIKVCSAQQRRRTPPYSPSGW